MLVQGMQKRKEVAEKAICDMYTRLFILAGKDFPGSVARNDTNIAERALDESIAAFIRGEVGQRPSEALARYERLRAEEILDVKRGRRVCDECGNECRFAVIDDRGTRTCPECFRGRLSKGG